MSERYTETASAETARSDVAATSLPLQQGKTEVIRDLFSVI